MTRRFLSNIYDPKQKDAPMLVTQMPHETYAQAWQHQQEWLSGKIIDKPQSTPLYTVEQLEAMNMVGVYVEEQCPAS